VSFLKRPELVIILGFIFVTLGITILSLSGSNYEEGFVFVFPFFFFGNVDSMVMLPIIGLMFLITISFILMFSNWMNLNRHATISNEIPTYVRYDSMCAFCGEQMPKTAKFCPACGHVREKNNQFDDPSF
jgi:uncharacterized membrane protein